MKAIPDIFGCKFEGRDFLISELRIVRLLFLSPAKRKKKIFVSENYDVRYMHKDQVDTFVQASVRLYFEEGNPHIKNPQSVADNLLEVRVSQLEVDTKSYWWCTKNLQNNDDPNGAQLNQVKLGQRVWAHPDLLAYEQKSLEEG